jgi:hypothetical protein
VSPMKYELGFISQKTTFFTSNLNDKATVPGCSDVALSLQSDVLPQVGHDRSLADPLRLTVQQPSYHSICSKCSLPLLLHVSFRWSPSLIVRAYG